MKSDKAKNTDIELKETSKMDGSNKYAGKDGKVDWKDPKLLAEMGAAAAIIVIFMALTGGFGAITSLQ